MGNRTHGDLFELEFGRHIEPVAVEVAELYGSAQASWPCTDLRGQYG